MKVISRSEAKSLGLFRYFTGEPCLRGHVSERRVTTGMCCTCAVEHTRRHRVENAASVAASKAAYRVKNSDAEAARRRLYYEKNREDLLLKRKQYYAENTAAESERARLYRQKNRAQLLERERSYRQSNVSRRSALEAVRRSRSRRAVPLWFSELDALVWLEAADLVRLRSAATGFAWHADHMIPLACRKASGLHVWNNCQVIPASLNAKKKNKFVLTDNLEWLQYI